LFREHDGASDRFLKGARQRIKLGSFDWNATNGPALAKRLQFLKAAAMVRLRKLPRASNVLLTVLLPATAAAAAPRTGALAAQSRAAISISVSVAPRFSVLAAETTIPPAAEGAEAFDPPRIRSNAPGVRYAVRADNADRRTSVREIPLVIIVPD
jgi:folate-binding Fe-S cluster repair protein YgfZ